VREGPEAYVFRQNGDLFGRRPVRVLHEDRLNVVSTNDGSIPLGMYVAQGPVASLTLCVVSGEAGRCLGREIKNAAWGLSITAGPESSGTSARNSGTVHRSILLGCC
jgi:hypothetical protein